MKITPKFKFVGELGIPQDFDKFFRQWNGGASGKLPMASISFSVREGQNRGFVECFGMKNDVIKTFNTEKGKIEIPWEDRLDPEVIKMVASYRKFVVNLGEEYGGKKEFLTEYDMITYLAEVLPKYQGVVQVTGVWKKDPYNGNIRDRYIIQNVFSPDTFKDPIKASKPKLLLQADLFYNKDCVDDTSFKDDKKIYVNGYVQQYVDKETGDMYFPQRAILSAEKYDMEKEQHVKTWEHRKGHIVDKGITKKHMYHLYWEARLINGAEEIEFDESMLTSQQKEQIALGIRTLDDFRPRGNIFGSKITEVRLLDPILTNDFAEGVVECPETLEEFESKVYKFAAVEKLEDAIKESEVVEEDDDDDDDELF